MKYIIADSDEQTGIDLKEILDSFETLEFRGNFTDLEAVEKSIHREAPDIAFIRIGKVEQNAFKLVREIRQLNPLSKVFIHSIHKEYAVEAFECEADGFFLLPFVEEKVIHLLEISNLNKLKQSKTVNRRNYYRI